MNRNFDKAQRIYDAQLPPADCDNRIIGDNDFIDPDDLMEDDNEYRARKKDWSGIDETN